MRCKSCGSEIEAGERFCGDCGAPYIPEAAPFPSEGAASTGGDHPHPPVFQPPPPYFQAPPAAAEAPAASRAPAPPRARQAAPQTTPRQPRSGLRSCAGLLFSLFLMGVCFPLATVVVIPAVRSRFTAFLEGMITAPTETPGVESAALPTVTWLPVTPTPPAAPLLKSFSYRGVSFDYDPALGSRVNAAVVPAVAGSSSAASPTHLTFTLEGFPSGGSRHRAQIRIYLADEYRSANPGAAEIIDNLKSLVATQGGEVQGDLPFLPVMNAAQLIRAQALLFGFQSGLGLRYLTQYGQGSYPINNQDLIYTYQGLTGDGEYYISVSSPIAHPELPANGTQIPGGDFQAFDQQFESYTRGLTRMLDEADPADFSPDMNQLDALIWSITVRK